MLFGKYSYDIIIIFMKLFVFVQKLLNPLGNNQFGVEEDEDPWFIFKTDDTRKINSLIFAEFTFKRKQ